MFCIQFYEIFREKRTNVSSFGTIFIPRVEDSQINKYECANKKYVYDLQIILNVL